MKLFYLLLWLAGGGLVALEVYACIGLLKACESRHDDHDEQVWEMLLPRESA